MRLSLFIVAAFLIGACASPEGRTVSRNYVEPPAALYSVGGIGYGGPSISQLKPDDVRQIIKLAANRSDILKPVYGIYATATGRADVSTGDMHDSCTEFQVQKRSGRWRIIPRSVHRTHPNFIGLRDLTMRCS